MRYKRLQRRWNLTAEEICRHRSVLCNLLFKSCSFNQFLNLCLESPTAADCCNPRFAIAINIRFLAGVLSLRVLRYQPEITTLRASPVATVNGLCVKFWMRQVLWFWMRWVPQWWESGFALVNLHLIMEVSNDWPKKKNAFSWPITTIGHTLVSGWPTTMIGHMLAFVGLPQQLAGHKVQICDTCSIGIKYCIRLKIWLLLFTLFKSLHLQNRCTNLTIIMLKSLIHNTDCMPFFFYEWRNRDSVQQSTHKYHHLIASHFQNIQNVLTKRV